MIEEIEQRGYTKIAHLKTGGQGDVYTCEKQGTAYLVKVVDLLEEEQLDVLKGINALGNDFFPRIIEIINSGKKTIIIREFIKGTTLHDEIEKNEVFSYRRAKEIIFDICSAIRALHALKPRPIIYRDLKPENVIITPEGKIKLIDFGIARYYKTESTRDTVLAGTKGYTAPEVMAGMQSDERSDVYSIGLVFYELLSGKSLQDPPFQIRPIAENNEYIPDYTDEIIAKATDINQTNRYATIDEFVYDLENIKLIKEKHKSKKKRKTVIAVLLAIIFLAVAAALLFPLFFGEKVETLLALEFEDENDINYLSMDSKERIEISGGTLNVKDWCGLKYRPKNGMLVHFKVKTSDPGGSLGLSQYRLNPSLQFECIYYDEQKNTDITTWEKQMQGFPIVNSQQWLDIILYTNEQNSAVYAVICDNESRKIAYIAYQIPEFFNEESTYIEKDKTFYVEMMTFFESEDNFLTIDYINISQGSLKQYLKENMAAYAQHRSITDEFLSQDVADLPEMVFKPANEW